MADDFKPGLEGVIAFESQIAEPDKEGSALRLEVVLNLYSHFRMVMR